LRSRLLLQDGKDHLLLASGCGAFAIVIARDLGKLGDFGALPGLGFIRVL